MDTHLVNQRGAQLWHVASPWAPYQYAENSGLTTAYRVPFLPLELVPLQAVCVFLIIRARVLKSGGRLAFADIVTEVQLPDGIICNSTHVPADRRDRRFCTIDLHLGCT